jgi:hypothetical protein
MSLMELFSGSNTGNTDKKTGVTATGRATQGGNTSNTGNTADNSIKVKNDAKNTVIVICYNPLGYAFDVEANSVEHAAFLQRMNPSRT